jgi:hypothetical protein
MNKLYNLEARGVGTPVSCRLVQQRPGMLYRSHFRGEDAFAEKDGRTWMLLVSLLGDKRLKPAGSWYWTLFPGSERQAAPDINARDF